MKFTKYDMFAYQILDYLISKHSYQIIKVQQHMDDIWLFNAKQEFFPIIRISSNSNDVAPEDTEYIRSVHMMISNLIKRESPIIILNTNPECTPIENAILTQIRITPNEISDEKILKIFHELKEVVHDTEDMDKEISFLTKDIEEIQLNRHKKLLAQAKAQRVPRVTIGIIILCLIFAFSAVLLDFLLNDHILTLVVCGAFYKMNVVAAHEYWRLLTAGFLHPNLITFAINMFVLYHLGKQCEPVFKMRNFFIIILLSVIVGNLFVLIADVNILTMGIGSGIAGIMGAYLMNVIMDRAIRIPYVQRQLAKSFFIALLPLFFGGLSIYAYAGGFVTGSLLGVFFYGSEQMLELRRHTAVASFLLLITLCFLGIKTTAVLPVDEEFDTSIVNVYRHTALNRYADYLQKCYNEQYKGLE